MRPGGGFEEVKDGYYRWLRAVCGAARLATDARVLRLLASKIRFLKLPPER